MDFKQLASNLDIEEDEFKELVDLFVGITLSDLEKIKRGLDSKSAYTVSQAANAIKGASANLGFEAVSQLAKEIETMAEDENFEGLEQNLNALMEKVDEVAAAVKG